jgi:hypothetical protein
MAIRHRITTLPDPGPINKSRRASLFGKWSPYLRYHRGPPAVIGDCEHRRDPKAVNMSNLGKLSIREWLVPPVLLPIFFVLVVAAAMLIQW